MELWRTNYEPPQPTNWAGRDDGIPNERIFQIVQTCDWSRAPIEGNGEFALVGFACDEGIRRNKGRIGAKEGPVALRKALGNISLHAGKEFHIYDMGDITCSVGDLEKSQLALAEFIVVLKKAGFRPIVLGGGHELAYGHYLGLRDSMNVDNLSIINFGSHLDLKEPIDGKGSSETPMYQIALDRKANNLKFDYHASGILAVANTKTLFKTAEELNVHILRAEQYYIEPQAMLAAMDEYINTHDQIYVSVSLDVFTHSYAPGVSFPHPHGMIPWQVLPMLRKLGYSGKVVAFDIAELSPTLDHHNATSTLGALLIAEFIFYSYKR